ncbi:MAG: hypothetical protein Q7J34_11000 [Bacteroidales bacterium]|nr:hypothetical protein [Bacteroidales bacterium]
MFNYKEFKEEMRCESEAKYHEVILKFDKVSSAEIIEDEPFWSYLKAFDPSVSFAVPEEFEEDFGFLFRLIAASLSCDWRYVFPTLNECVEANIDPKEIRPELMITVGDGEQSRDDSISSLWSFQVKRLIEIYLAEQMNLEHLKITDSFESVSLIIDREKRIRYYRKTQNEAQQKLLRLEAML